MPEAPNTDGWPKWSAWVVEGLKETKAAIESARLETKADIALLRAEIKADIATLRANGNKTKQDVTRLQVKSGLWGAAGASIPVIIMLALQYWR